MEKQQFKAESQRLLDLMINSIYTHQEIFLREILSNASDAIDKLAYTALTDDKVGISRDQFAITITRSEADRTLTVSDNGIGMSKEEMEENLGTICKSGSLGFKQAMEKQEDIDIIGQFGVGFYSAFMVAKSVTVISKKYGSDQAWKWESNGADGYTIEPADRGREVFRVPGGIQDPGAGAEIFRLPPLPHPHGSHQVPEEGGFARGQARIRGLHRDGDPELHGASVAAEQEGRDGGGI